MAKIAVKNYTLYKLRFWIGHGLLGLIIAAVLTIAALYVPGGLTQAEQQSVLQSAAIDISNPASMIIVDFPYHALQRLSIALLGLNDFSVKLPSLLFGVASIIGLILLLLRRFKQTISILATGIILISAQFISLATIGTPDIMFVFWSVMLLLIATYGIRGGKVSPAILYIGGITAALSLFTPFTLYIILALTVATLLHPHLRYILRRTPTAVLATNSLLVAAAVALIAVATTKDPSFISRLLYMSESFSLNIVDNLAVIGLQLADITSASTPVTGLLTPIFGISVIAISLIGMIVLMHERHSVLSYMVFSWTSLLTPVILLNPDTLFLLIVPMAFFVAVGCSQILSYWYQLFPQNPYARIFALLPVSILFSCVIISGVGRYFYGFQYYAPLANRSIIDMTLVNKELASQPDARLLVAKDEEAFYRLLLAANDDSNEILVYNDNSSKKIPSGATYIATRRVGTSLPLTPTYIVADSAYNRASDRLYIYNISDK